MSNALAGCHIKMGNHYIYITVNQDTGQTTCFKRRGEHCDFQSFDSQDQDSIVEYIIEPISLDRWQFQEAQ